LQAGRGLSSAVGGPDGSRSLALVEGEDPQALRGRLAREVVTEYKYQDKDGRRPGPTWEESRSREGQNPGYVDAGDNAFISPLTQPLSTLALDVDTGSYANIRRFLNSGLFPPRAGVRVEEMINYFTYRYP